jgi:hypothetical protein
MGGLVIVCAAFLSGWGWWFEDFFKTWCFEEDKKERR